MEEDYRTRLRKMFLAVNRIDGLYYRVAKRMGIKENTLTLLYALDDGTVHSQKQICEEWLIPRTTLNTIVKECVEKGYIVLSVEGHTKEKNICLTPKGKVFAGTVYRNIYRAEEEAMRLTARDFSFDFIRAIETFADYLQENFDQYVTSYKDSP